MFYLKKKLNSVLHTVSKGKKNTIIFYIFYMRAREWQTFKYGISLWAEFFFEKPRIIFFSFLDAPRVILLS